MSQSFDVESTDLADVPALRNLSPAELYEFALAEGDLLTSTGALSAASGACTGRSPNDKRIVDEPAVQRRHLVGQRQHQASAQLVRCAARAGRSTF